MTETLTWAHRDEVRIADQLIARGTRQVLRLPVLTDLDGSEIALTIHAIVGAQPGPTLALHTVLHGSEWQTAELARHFAASLDPAVMHGAVLILPVANPIALASRTRNLRDESASPDLNRSFGGEQTWLADQLARAIATHLLAHADALVDFHCGLWGAAMYSVTVGTDFANPDVSQRSFELARSFGLPFIRRAELATRFPGPRSSVGYAGQVLGVPSVVVEVGGAGFDPETEASWQATSLRGLQGVLQGMGIVAGEPPLAERTLIFQRVKRVNPRNGGMLEPVFAAEDMMIREVQAGDLLGRVWSPYSLEVIEELRAPFRGLIEMAPRAYPARPGDWAYLVVDLDDSGTRWIAPTERP
jgi:predicted deacylase